MRLPCSELNPLPVECTRAAAWNGNCSMSGNVRAHMTLPHGTAASYAVFFPQGEPRVFLLSNGFPEGKKFFFKKHLHFPSRYAILTKCLGRIRPAHLWRVVRAGRRSTIGNRVNANPVSRVRIPHSPPAASRRTRFAFDFCRTRIFFAAHKEISFLYAVDINDY